MMGHDSVKELSELIGDSELLKKISPKFNEMTLDIQEVLEYSKNPMFIAVLLFKLSQEREKTNQLLEKINEKFDSIMLRLKTAPLQEQILPAQFSQPQMGMDFFEQGIVPLKALPENDQLIVHLAFEKGQISADDIKKELGYKGKNAASQRLNKLVKEGHLKKIQAGRKVVFLARTI
jgi:cyanate lyase